MTETQKEKFTQFVNSQYDALASWLNSAAYEEYIGSKIPPGHITYYVQMFLICSVFDFYLKGRDLSGLGNGILEIGCAEGNLSEMLANVACKNDALYVALDPWCGAQEGDEAKYQIFSSKVNKSKGSVKVYRQSSQSPETIGIINDNNIGAVYVDGLHTAQASYNDIAHCAKSNCCELICVDDLQEGSNRDAQAGFDEAVKSGLISPVEIWNQESYNKVTEFKQYKFAFINR
jgi:hypothetical protein